MKKSCFSVAMVFIVGVTGTTVESAPIQDEAIIQIRQFENTQNPVSNTLTNFTTINNSITNTLGSSFGSTIQAHGSLATGRTGTRSTITSLDSKNIASRVILSDTLTFNTVNGLSSEVSYQLSFDGMLSNFGTGSFGGFASAEASVSIFDITGLNTWLDDFDDPDSLIGTTATLVSKTDIGFVVGSQTFVNALAPSGAFDELVVDTSGTVFEFDLTQTASFIADPTKKYGIQIDTRSKATGVSSSDFLNTSAFQLTELNGATFDSGSGAFLTQTVVPVPAAVWLFGSGLLCLMGNRKRK